MATGPKTSPQVTSDSNKYVVSSIIILLLVAAVSVVVITVSIDKINNHSKTNIHSIT